MPALAIIQDQLHRSFEGEAWHGPAVLEILKDVTARQAAAKPIPGIHSIWELVLHVATWQRIVTRRLKGEACEPTPAQNFPKVRDKSAGAWKRALALLGGRHGELAAAVAALPEARLSEIVPGKNYTVEFMLHGAIQHDLYHAGQMALLKKALSA